jgi:hypothetical protein
LPDKYLALLRGLATGRINNADYIQPLATDEEGIYDNFYKSGMRHHQTSYFDQNFENCIEFPVSLTTTTTLPTSGVWHSSNF